MATSSQSSTTYASDLAYQTSILQGVSRTFALTIPRLPEGLRSVVGNAYLLCRIADTIEDSDTLTLEEKKEFSTRFVEAVQGREEAQAFAESLRARLGGSTLESEKNLVENTARVLRITRGFPGVQQAILARCVRIMTSGMEHYQAARFRRGLPDLKHLDRYCYYVAGVVGEMLTDLFCQYSAKTAQKKEALSKLAVSFGQGLQMTNILKDIWDDKERDTCWLPEGVFQQEGFDLNALAPGAGDSAFEAGLVKLIAIAHAHLENALRYTLLIPKSEKGIREFCLWAIGMAVLTLRRINHNRRFTSGTEVKISRRSVRATILAAKLLGGSNMLLRMLFSLAARGLPRTALEAGA
ncbi:MAG: squalene/phytoene synthase family protein [Candidatus Hydrogenedentes bacterium]|nr:squalene/phytoene synthase family protein [Candidatus Hydrogenedentota bacterium]